VVRREYSWRFVVRDAERRPIAYVYGHDRPRQIEGVPSPLTIDEAREVALSIAELSEVLLGKDKASQDGDQRPSPPSAGKMGKRSRFHSITSSARASNVGGISRPSSLAVFRLMTSSYLVGVCTGRSAGFSPLRILSA
jgi:hypothetical protein